MPFRLPRFASLFASRHYGQEPPAIAIVSVNKLKASETFIHNHVRHLPARVHYLTGDYLPVRYCLGLDGQDRSFVAGAEARVGEPLWAEQRPRRLQAIARYLRAHRIQAVLAEYGLAGVEMMDICRSEGIPLIVHFHGFDAYRDDIMHWYGPRYPELFGTAGALIGVSRHMCTQLERLGAAAAKVHWNPCGFDTELFTYREAGTHPPVFVSVGRFTAKKGPDLTLQAFAQVYRACPEARLWMVGDGEMQAECRSLVHTLGLAQAVSFCGELAHAEVAARMAAARAFVQHSLTTPTGDREGTPVAVIEACGAGLPVVATRHGGIPDVVGDGETGVLVDEGDIAHMAAAMLRLARDPDLATTMGRAGYERVRQIFSLQAHIERLWTVIYASFHAQ